MAEHTEGPWVRRPRRFGVAIEGSNGQSVAWCSESISSRTGVAPYKENAYLIAAAPDLLEALEGLYLYVTDVDGNHVPPLSQAKAAIAKARGE